MDETIYAQYPLFSGEGRAQIRVLELEQGGWDDTIKCSLVVVDLNSLPKPGFEAISYVWGDKSEDPPQTLVDGHKLNVGVNLHTALRHFRSKTKTRTLWVDAICINQNNVKERNQQVEMMRDIYHQCERVLIWLGESKATTPQTSQMGSYEWKTDFSGSSPHPTIHDHDRERIRQFVARYKRYYELPFALRYHSRIDSDMGAYCLISLLAQNMCLNKDNFSFLRHEASRNIFLVLADIVSAPWWTRIWVIQELVFAPQAMIYYGRFIAPWDLYVRAARNYNAHRGTCCESHYQWLQPYDIRLLEAFMHAVLEIDDLRQVWQALLRGGDRGGDNSQIYLRHLLWKFRRRVSSDPRDQIYALLSLVNSWGGERSVFVNYSVNVDMKTLYQITTERIINADKSLLVLAGVTAKKEGRHVLPSWVPDWTTQPSSRFESERLERIHLFKASNGAKMELPVKIVGGSLMRLHGKCVDEVTVVSDLMTYDDQNLERSFDTFASWKNLVTLDMPMTAKYVTGKETRMEAYWRTLCMDTVRKNTGKGAPYGKGYEYQRCAPDYIQKSLDSWMDPELTPHLAHTRESQCQDATSTDDLTREATKFTSSLGGNLVEELSSHNEGLNYIEVDFAICSATMDRRIFGTKDGFLGLGPSDIRNGDQVYIFEGGHVPFIVRKAPNRNILGEQAENCFELVGDCYVHGIMDGELVPEEMSQEQAIWLV